MFDDESLPSRENVGILIFLEQSSQQAKPCMMVSQADEIYANLSVSSKSAKPKKVSGSREVFVEVHDWSGKRENK